MTFLTESKKELLKDGIQEILKAHLNDKELNVERKIDGSEVTKIDLEISELFEKHVPDTHIFFSEENHDELKYPAIILDPIDGTKELIKRNGECSVSFCLANNDKLEGESWIYNPFNGFSIQSNAGHISYKKENLRPLLGYVSKSEWNKGMFDNVNKSIVHIQPVGSIAYKLGLLAAGLCDFVVSLQPKSLWDVAAGSAILKEKGINFYIDGVKVESFTQKRINADVLLWANDEVYEKVKNVFS